MYSYEIRQEFEAAIADTGWTEVTEALKQSDYLLSCVLKGKAEVVALCVDKIHELNTSILQYNDENSLACVLLLAFDTSRSRYQIIRALTRYGHIME